MNNFKLIIQHNSLRYSGISLPTGIDACFNQLNIEKPICFILLDDEALLKMNRELLQHDYYTDIITLDYSDDQDYTHSEIYISLDRVAENAKNFNVPFENELHRVFIHGMLHLGGFNDKSEEEKEIMRAQEDHYLALLRST